MKKIILSLFVAAFLASSASASMVDANIVRGKPAFSIGLSGLQGFGAVGTVSFPFDTRVSAGGSFGYSFDSGNPYLFDVVMSMQFLEPTAKNPLSASLIGGVWGGTSDGFWLSKNKKEQMYVLPEIGVGLSYVFNSRLTGRFNLVYGPNLGVELGYKFNPSIEGIIAVSEQIVGIKFKLF